MNQGIRHAAHEGPIGLSPALEVNHSCQAAHIAPLRFAMVVTASSSLAIAKAMRREGASPPRLNQCVQAHLMDGRIHDKSRCDLNANVTATEVASFSQLAAFGLRLFIAE